jgi:hypothetical protein
MPAIKLFAGMARSYRRPAISFTDKHLSQKMLTASKERIIKHYATRFCGVPAA